MIQVLKHRIQVSFPWDVDKNIEINDNCVLDREHRFGLGISVITFVHPELPETDFGNWCFTYDFKRAKAKFPYLFADTNPLLYRNFDDLRYSISNRQIFSPNPFPLC